MRYGLKADILDQIIQVFASFPEVEEVVLYGSRAMGNFKPGSDIDITMKGDLLDLTTLNKISLMLDDLYLPYKIDLSFYNYIDHPDLLDHIRRVGKVIYKRM